MVNSRNKKHKRRKDNRQSTVLQHYFLTYFTVLFIPLLICSLYYIRMLSLLSEDDSKARESELEHAAVLVDTVLNEFEYLGDSLAANLQVNSFKRTKEVFGYANTYKVYELRKSLPDLYLINQSVFDYFIFFDRSETVINKTIAYTYEDFYNLYLHEKKYGSYEEWYEHIKNDDCSFGLMPMEEYLYKKEQSINMLDYTRPLMMPDGAGNGRIHIYLEESVMETLMPAIADNSIQFITDASGRLLYLRNGNPEKPWTAEEMHDFLGGGVKTPETGSWQQEVRFMGEKYMMLSYSSGKSGLIYSMLLPQKVINDRMMSSIMILSLFILLGVTVGLLLSYHMSVKSATPINDILNQVSQVTERFEGHQNVFSSLKTTFNYLVSTNSRLADAIESQKPYIRNAFINRLIFGSFIKEEEADKIEEHIGFPCAGRVYGIIIFRFHLISESIREENLQLMSSCVFSLLEVIERELPGSLYTNLGDEQVVLLLNMPEKEKLYFRQNAEQMVLSIKEAMPSNISEKLFAYGGNEVDRLDQIYDSFHNAAYMFNNESGQIENAVIWYREAAGSIPVYPPQDLSVKLTHYVTAGDGDGLHDLLEDIMKKYIIENNLSVYLQHMLLNELQIVLFRILGRVGMEEEEYRKYYTGLEENHNAALITQITTTLNLYKQVCDYVGRQKQLQDSEVVASAIVSYIDTNYGDCCLSLTSVADQFGISEPYLSSIFKQTQGINFSTYVEVIRIDKAKDFLKTTALSVGDIAQLVGYGSVNSFCRAFKRVTGLSASEYRKK